LKNDIVQENGCHVTCRITVKNRPIKIQAKPESNLAGSCFTLLIQRRRQMSHESFVKTLF
jgi:hypothetical protein